MTSELPDEALLSRLEALRARRNAEARQTLLREFGDLTNTEAADSAGLSVADRTAIDRWEQEGKVFAVNHGTATYFPAFQFGEAGQPRPVIAAILAALGEVTDWQRALWFTTANGWLGGCRPVDLLDGSPAATAALTASAQHVGEGLLY